MHIGVAWGRHGADPVDAYFGNATFLPGQRAQPMRLRHWFHGMTTEGRRVEVMIDSVNTEAEHGEAALHVRVRGTHLDSAETALFWDTNDALTVLPSGPARLDSAAADLLKDRARVLHRAALADTGAVPTHNTVAFATPDVRGVEAMPDVVTVYYPMMLKQGDSTVDDRANAFFLYSIPGRRVLFETFGHPEWGPRADKVVSVSTTAFFRISGDPHTYLLALRLGAWESPGSWVIFDLATGKRLL